MPLACVPVWSPLGNCLIVIKTKCYYNINTTTVRTHSSSPMPAPPHKIKGRPPCYIKILYLREPQHRFLRVLNPQRTGQLHDRGCRASALFRLHRLSSFRPAPFIYIYIYIAFHACGRRNKRLMCISPHTALAGFGGRTDLEPPPVWPVII